MSEHLKFVVVDLTLYDIYRKLCAMPGLILPKTQAQARRYCCAVGGVGKAELLVTPILESMIKKYIHPIFRPV